MLKHILVIPDGNRRYAKERNCSLQEIYDYAIIELTTKLLKFFLIEKNIPEVTIYGISLNNILKRKAEELEPIFKPQIKAYKKWLTDNDFKNAQVAFRFFGEIEKLPKNYKKIIKELEAAAPKKPKKMCNLLVGYDAEAEIVNAINCAQKNKGRISQEKLRDFLQLKTPIDVVFRSGYEKRLSGAPLIQSSQAELIFADYYYPELNKKRMEGIIEEYNNRKRRHGQ
ncbi:MAG: undecaprenyl diphosphate synthase family protein [Candidatus Diapherotrites archaeon]